MESSRTGTSAALFARLSLVGIFIVVFVQVASVALEWMDAKMKVETPDNQNSFTLASRYGLLLMFGTLVLLVLFVVMKKYRHWIGRIILLGVIVIAVSHQAVVLLQKIIDVLAGWFGGATTENADHSFAIGLTVVFTLAFLVILLGTFRNKAIGANVEWEKQKSWRQSVCDFK